MKLLENSTVKNSGYIMGTRSGSLSGMITFIMCTRDTSLFHTEVTVVPVSNSLFTRN